MNEKIKAINPQIVVHGTPEKPYYEISYYDTGDNQWHIGYSSYDLQTVKEYLENCFEIIEADVEPVKHAAFVRDEEHWYICGNCHHATCSEFDLEGEYKKIEINGKVETIYALKQPNYCKHCGSKMDGKEVQE